MEQLEPFSDDRLLAACIYCGAQTQSRDHVPSRVLLDEPFPANLPAVPACHRCNNGFSDDERYLACLIDCVLAGSTDPAAVQRLKVRRTLEARPALRRELEAARTETTDGATFLVENNRVQNVLRKLIRGHAAYELSESQLDPRAKVGLAPLPTMVKAARDSFERPDVASIWPEVGTRAMQRMVLWGFGDGLWITVQPGRYRYAAFLNGGIVVRVVLSEYLAAEAQWQ